MVALDSVKSRFWAILCSSGLLAFSVWLLKPNMSKKVPKYTTGTAVLVDSLQKKGIKLVAVDFDQTLITIHTGGHWSSRDSIDTLLVPKVRPCIKDLIEMSLNRGLHVCIVTFHSQPNVIAELLQKLFKSDADRILIQGNTPSFLLKNKGEFLGKESHISSILTELYNKEQLKIRSDEVILFDDDRENTDYAIKFGHMAFLVEEDVCEETFTAFSRTLDSTELRKSWVK